MERNIKEKKRERDKSNIARQKKQAVVLAIHITPYVLYEVNAIVFVP